MLVKKKVTIIEDDLAILQMYEYKFETAGYEVSTATDGDGGLHVLERNVPDLILLDINLPHMPGQEVLKRIRATNWGKDIKVIVLTNVGKDEAPQELRELNVDAYAVKAHYTPSQVLELAKKILK